MRLILYNLLLPFIWMGAVIASLCSPKVKRTLGARKHLWARWKESLPKDRPPATTVWFHVSSAGEFLQARPVIDLLSERYFGRIGIALTFFSPSGYDYYMKHDRARRNPSVFFVDYLPFDTPSNSRSAIEALKPDMIVYTKYDVWPNLALRAASLGIPQVLLSAAAPEGSRMFSPAAAWFFSRVYSAMDRIGAVSEEAAARFRKLTGPGTEVTVTGDIRFDQVARRIDSPTSEIPASIKDDKRVKVIAGSTWPRDEEMLISGFRILKESGSDILLVLAPHEPTPERIDEIGSAMRREGLGCAPLSSLEPGDTTGLDAVIADGIGYLAELYTIGSIAYVGGSWTSGIHNVLEPAAAGLPVFFGPRYGNAWEASRLIDTGAGLAVTGSADFAEKTAGLLEDEERLRKAGEIASRFVRDNTGASGRSLGLIERSLDIHP